jgi:hypothetical protein
MNVTHVVGVDPGLVHTGVVSLLFKPAQRSVLVSDRVVLGPDPDATRDAVPLCGVEPRIFIEGYRPRSHLHTDAEMTKAVLEMKKALPGSKVLLNTGVKKVVKPQLMELLGCWKFGTVTHHQDLRSAARIALLGMAKDEELNKLLALVVSDHLEGRTWDVHH